MKKSIRFIIPFEIKKQYENSFAIRELEMAILQQNSEPSKLQRYSFEEFWAEEGQISFINLKDISNCYVENRLSKGRNGGKEAARRILIW